MVKRKIVWSDRAIKRLFGILEFYDQRNKSKTYSKKLYRLIQKQVSVLIKLPDIGLKTTEDTIKGLIVGDYIIYYQITDDKIIIHTIWDSRQNPDGRIIK
jgi:plasmid stabilization system protein ParE